MKKIIIFSFFLTMFFGANVALAENPFSKSVTKLNAAVGKTGLESDLGTSIGTIVQALLATVGTIFLILTIYAGILWMTAQGNEEKVGKAKQIVTAAVIGLVITVSAYAITAFVTGKLGSSAPNSGRSCTDLTGTCDTTANCLTAGGTARFDTDCASPNVCCIPSTN